jgi:hypothetical protein
VDAGRIGAVADVHVLSGEITGMPIATGGDGYSWVSSPDRHGRDDVQAVLARHGDAHEHRESSTPFVTLEVASVTGDVPALGRLIVTDTASQSRRHVEWGLEGPLTYNSGTSLLIDSDNMVTSGFAGTQTTLVGRVRPERGG